MFVSALFLQGLATVSLVENLDLVENLLQLQIGVVSLQIGS